jgi:ribulose-phosphate 3-epimerase
MQVNTMAILISLSILQYEELLAKHLNNLFNSKVFSKISTLIDSREINSLHIDVMRPPFIKDKTTFSTTLIEKLYTSFKERIKFDIHLMTKEPELIVNEINNFIKLNDRANNSITLHREAYNSEEDVVKTLWRIKQMGYKSSVAIDLPTPIERLTGNIVENSDTILVMSVPVGKGAQKYQDVASQKIKSFKERYPWKVVQVDGGINEETARVAIKAGAEILVAGSYITASENPLQALMKLRTSLSDL